ncbi:MAG TPA: acyl transferase, partial [Flavisolibacter sp.]|nr:acyl transferase [Flavisolibacter sp.]
MNQLIDQVFEISNEKAFLQIALDVFRFQYFHNPVYGAYCKAIGRSPEMVTTLDAIPFLPISFFKTHSIKTGDFEPQTVFKSSGTTGATTSQHQVKDLSLYERSFLTCF